eukprot:gene3836-2716_t
MYWISIFSARAAETHPNDKNKENTILFEVEEIIVLCSYCYDDAAGRALSVIVGIVVACLLPPSATMSASSALPDPVLDPVVTLSYRRGALLSQCAESKVYCCDFYGVPAVCKHRFEKQYRHPKLDFKLRDQRTVREARALARCSLAGIRVPVVFAVHRKTCEIIMERIMGRTVKEVLDDETAPRQHTPSESAPPLLPPSTAARTASDPAVAVAVAKGETPGAAAGSSGEERSSPRSGLQRAPAKAAPLPLPLLTLSPLVTQLLEGIGEVVGLLHNQGMVHGDLTTSNFLYVESEGRAGMEHATADVPARSGLVVIDFGLITDKGTPEDRAVDLYVLLRAFSSTHPALEAIAEENIVRGYRRTAFPKHGEATLQRLDVVRARGRKRSMVG